MRVYLSFAVFLGCSVLSWAQQRQSHEAPVDDMSAMEMNESMPSYLPSFHVSSGTTWQPASVQEPMWMRKIGQWQLMLHGTVFITDNQQGGPRGEGKAESVNYVMTMEQHSGEAHYCFVRCFQQSLLHRHIRDFLKSSRPVKPIMVSP
jgi:hypothetical protein